MCSVILTKEKVSIPLSGQLVCNLIRKTISAYPYESVSIPLSGQLVCNCFKIGNSSVIFLEESQSLYQVNWFVI